MELKCYYTFSDLKILFALSVSNLYEEYQSATVARIFIRYLLDGNAVLVNLENKMSVSEKEEILLVFQEFITSAEAQVDTTLTKSLEELSIITNGKPIILISNVKVNNLSSNQYFRITRQLVANYSKYFSQASLFLTTENKNEIAGWKFLKDYRVPSEINCIIDPYLFNKNSECYKNNLVKIVRNLFANQKSNVLLISASNDETIKKNMEYVYNLLVNDDQLKGNSYICINFNYYKIPNQLARQSVYSKFHDRYILTQYSLIQSGNSFDIANSNSYMRNTRISMGIFFNNIDIELNEQFSGLYKSLSVSPPNCIDIYPANIKYNYIQSLLEKTIDYLK